MKEYICIAILWLAHLTGFSQDASRVFGPAADSVTLNPVSFVSVSILNQKQVAIKSVISDAWNFDVRNIPRASGLVLTAIVIKESL